jgi:hypothetical protein
MVPPSDRREPHVGKGVVSPLPNPGQGTRRGVLLAVVANLRSGLFLQTEIFVKDGLPVERTRERLALGGKEIKTELILLPVQAVVQLGPRCRLSRITIPGSREECQLVANDRPAQGGAVLGIALDLALLEVKDSPRVVAGQAVVGEVSGRPS